MTAIERHQTVDPEGTCASHVPDRLKVELCMCWFQKIGLIERVLGQGCSAVPWPSCQPSSASTAIGKAPRKIG